MTAYRTCHNCRVDRATCPRLSAIKTQVAGLNLTSVKFKCADRVPLYAPGDRVMVTWTVSLGDYPDEANDEMWPATVVGEKGSQFIICVDDVDSDEGTPAKSYVHNDTLYAKASANRLAVMTGGDNAPRSVCGLCGEIKENGLKACYVTGTYKNPKCLKTIDGIVDEANPSSPNGQFDMADDMPF